MRTLIAVPCMDMVHTDFFRSCVGLDLDGDIQWTTCQGSLPYDARNKLADIAIEQGFDRVLWLDSDMLFDRHLFRRLSEHLDMGKDIVTGLCFTRKPPIVPVICKSLRMEPDPEHPDEPARSRPVMEFWTDYERDSLFEVEACGFAAVMMTTAALRDVRDRLGLPFYPVQGLGEDLAFCRRARHLGYRIWCDSSIKVGHVGTAVYNEDVFRAAQKAARENTQE